ncbi:ferredoxin [Nocardia salmonicida]|uniref:ferredoxin n=1 Tax=Nocardia salmonicida TaxID=53431 RepID=UPI0037B8827C
MATPSARTVRVDPRRCEGHGLCLIEAPEAFDLTDDETAFYTGHLGPGQLVAVQAAAAACPRQAITVTDATDPHREERL